MLLLIVFTSSFFLPTRFSSLLVGQGFAVFFELYFIYIIRLLQSTARLTCQGGVSQKFFLSPQRKRKKFCEYPLLVWQAVLPLLFFFFFSLVFLPLPFLFPPLPLSFLALPSPPLFTSSVFHCITPVYILLYYLYMCFPVYNSLKIYLLS